MFRFIDGSVRPSLIESLIAVSSLPFAFVGGAAREQAVRPQAQDVSDLRPGPAK